MPPRSSNARVRPILVLLGFALFLAVASIVVSRLDASALKPRLEASFERATGRALHIEGPLHLSLLPAPGFVADDVSVDNLAGGTRPAMFAARKVAGTVDLLALLGGTIHVENLAIADPDILLETIGGQPNWRFTRSPAVGGAAPRRTPPPRRGAPASARSMSQEAASRGEGSKRPGAAPSRSIVCVWSSRTNPHSAFSSRVITARHLFRSRSQQDILRAPAKGPRPARCPSAQR